MIEGKKYQLPKSTIFQNDDQFCQIIDIINTKVYPGSRQKIRIKNYQVICRLGGGAFGQVFKARDTHYNRFVALKIIDYDKIYQRYHHDQIKFAKLKKFLQTEETLMQKCNSPYVIKCYESLVNNHYKIFVLEYCNEGSLFNYLQKYGFCLKQKRAIEVLFLIYLGLFELHRNRIIHRDLKPENIMVHNGVFKIADFGLSRQFDHENSTSATICGSRETMAPEVKNGYSYNLKADVWSLGVIFFAMIYPKYQFLNRFQYVMKVLKEDFNFKNKDSQQITDETKDFLRRTICVNVDNRITTAQIINHKIFAVYDLSKLQRLYDEINKIQQSRIQINPDFQNSLFSHNDYQILDNEQQWSTRASRGSIFFDLNDITFIQDKQQINKQILQQNLENEQILQCRKAQFIIQQLISYLGSEDYKIIDMKSKQYAELMYLLSQRAFMNLSCINLRKSNSKLNKQFLKTLKVKSELIMDKYSNLLAKFKQKYLQSIKTVLKRGPFSKNKKTKRQCMFEEFEGEIYSKQDQIKETIEQIKKILPLVSTKSIKVKLLAYSDIMSLDPNKISHANIENIYQQILNKYC